MDGAYKHGKFLRRTGITETGEQLHQIFCGQRGKAERERAAGSPHGGSTRAGLG